MIKNLMELNDFVIGFCNYVVRHACEHTSSGNYFVDVNQALDVVGAKLDDFVMYKDIILDELSSREEVLDFELNSETLEFDVNCALAYCPNYEWCEGDEGIFGCSYEEWLEKPSEPIVDRPTYSQLMDTNYAQSVVPSVRFYVGDGINIDKDYFELSEALKAFKMFAEHGLEICLGIVQRGEATVLLDNVLGSVSLNTYNLNDVSPDVAEDLRSFMNEIYPQNDFCVGKWRVHVLAPGDKYGLNNCLEFEDKDSCVEFWDMSLDKNRFPEGQFTGGRYYISTLLSDEWGAGPDKLMRCGLCLNGDCRDAWSVSGEEMKKVYDWFKNRPISDGEHYLYCSGKVDIPHSLDSSHAWLYERLSDMAFVRDLEVEHVASHDDCESFAFSFVSQAEKSAVEKAMVGLLVGYGYELGFEAKKFEGNREALDSVITKCAAQVKDALGEKSKAKDLEK